MKLVITSIISLCMALMVSGVDTSVPLTTTGMNELQEEVSQLKKENNALRKENQKLRAKLVQQKTASSSTIKSKTETSNTNLNQDSSGAYWLTTSSKKRHNSSCKYYMRSKGRPCEKDEGIACKICGG